MSKKLYEETNIQDIASAIREKNGTQNMYTVSQMGNAVRAITTQPDLETLSVSQNGNYLPSAGKDGFSSVHVAVPGGTPNLQEKTVTQNGIVLPDSGYDGLSKVTVNVPSSEGLNIETFKTSSWTIVSQIDNGLMRILIGNELNRNNYNPFISNIINYFSAITVDDLKKIVYANLTSGYEYYSYIDNNIISALGLVLLGDFHSGGNASNNLLSDSIDNYYGIILQGIYSANKVSAYNTSILHIRPTIGTSYRAGMKDRNPTYDCFITFDDNQTVSLSGNRQVMIYGLPFSSNE